MQDAKISVERWVVWLNTVIQLGISNFSGVQGWLGRTAKFPAFYLVGITMECVS